VIATDTAVSATPLKLADTGLLETVMTYDQRLAEGAEHHGLRVLAPA